MAQARSSSLPVQWRGNPFWSARLQEELSVRSHRPLDLPPVPGGDEEDLEENPVLQDGGRQGRSKRRMSSREARGGEDRRSGVESFCTPEFSEKAMEKTEGRMPSGGSLEEEPTATRGVDELQRALERELMAQLHEENLKLKMELEKQKERSSRSSWSAVSPEVSAGPAAPNSTPPRSRTPSRRDWGLDEPRYTPQGTRVPEGPPPSDSLPELPTWPFEKQAYEVCDNEDPCHRRLGPGVVMRQKSGRRPLRDQECAGGADPRHDEAHGDKGSRGGMKSRQELCEEAHFVDGDVLSGAAARAVWLERGAAESEEGD